MTAKILVGCCCCFLLLLFFVSFFFVSFFFSCYFVVCVCVCVCVFSFILCIFSTWTRRGAENLTRNPDPRTTLLRSDCCVAKNNEMYCITYIKYMHVCQLPKLQSSAGMPRTWRLLRMSSIFFLLCFALSILTTITRLGLRLSTSSCAIPATNSVYNLSCFFFVSLIFVTKLT